MNEQHLVLTPEKVVVSYQLAGVSSRIFSHLFDLFAMMVIMTGVSFVMGIVGFAMGPELSAAISSLVLIVVFFAYFIVLEAFWNGQTLGKKILSLRVAMADGTPVTRGAATYRNLLRPADMFPGTYLVGLLSVFLNVRCQRLGDIAAGTVVIHETSLSRGFTPAPHRYGVHPFEDHVGTLHRMSLEEYQALKRLCDRFPELPPAIQNKSIAEIWNPFAAAHGIAPLQNVHPVYLMEAVVMKYGRQHKLI